MRIVDIAALLASTAAFTIAFPALIRAETGPQISGPFVYENLTAYFVHGKSADGPVPLTLQEALEKKTARLIETGSVNELKIENIGDEEIFIQSGDIVRGGRQDRVLTASLLLPKKSGEVPIASFCVEQGRWSARGGEDSKHFASAANAMPSREAKLAMKAPRGEALRGAETGDRQRDVWAEVAKTQSRLSRSLNEQVASAVSASSLELSLENEKLKKVRVDYIAALKPKGEAEDDIVGYVFAINGKLNSADIYPSNALFRKMWEKLLAASVTEAIGDRAEAKPDAAPSAAAVSEFLAAAESGKSSRKTIGGLVQQDTRDADRAVFVEAARGDGLWVHRNYLAK